MGSGRGFDPPVHPPCLYASDCIPFHDAGQHVGETKCVTGKVLRIKVGAKGVHFLDFCEDQMACPFTVVVFASGLKDVGDVRRLDRQGGDGAETGYRSLLDVAQGMELRAVKRVRFARGPARNRHGVQ